MSLFMVKREVFEWIERGRNGQSEKEACATVSTRKITHQVSEEALLFAK